MEKVLAIEKNEKLFRAASDELGKLGITATRACDMYQAVKALRTEGVFLLVTINGDDIGDYAAKLPMLRDLTDCMIIVWSNDYDIEKRLAALRLGADAFEPFSGDIRIDIHVALSLLDAQKRMRERPLSSARVLMCGDIFLSLSHNTVFVGDAEISLTRNEFMVMHCLLQRPNGITTYSQISRSVWDMEYDQSNPHRIWAVVKRIRVKLSAVSPEYADMIINVHGWGYRLLC